MLCRWVNEVITIDEAVPLRGAIASLGLAELASRLFTFRRLEADLHVVQPWPGEARQACLCQRPMPEASDQVWWCPGRACL